MSTRRLAVTIVAALLALGMGSCGGDDDSDSSGDGGTSSGELSGKIAVLLPDSKSSDRWETADRRFFEQGFEAAGLSKDDYIINNAEGDPAIQRNQAEQAITSGAKVMLLVNLDPGSGAAIIDDAKSQGVKMIDYDRLTVGGNADYYVSGDATEAGRLQAKGLIEDLKGKDSARIAILYGAPTDSFATDLKKGNTEILKSSGKSIDVAAEQAVPNWDGQKALAIYEQMLQASDEDFDGTLAANDTLANATIAARKSRELEDGPDQRPGRHGRSAPAHPGRRAELHGLLLDQGPSEQGRQAGGAAGSRRGSHRPQRQGRQREREGAHDPAQAADDPQGQHRRDGHRRRLCVVGGRVRRRV